MTMSDTTSKLSRRSALGIIAGAAGTLAAAGPMAAQEAAAQAASEHGGPVVVNGRLKQSVCRWCYDKIPLEDFYREAAAMGLKAIDLLSEKDWPLLKQYGLTCAMPNGPGGIPVGWNRMEHHDKLVAESERLLPLIKEHGFANMIVFSGNRKGLSDAEGIENCAAGLKRIIPLAEKLEITLCMELLNSKKDHKDYQCDKTAWGVELCKAVGSPRFKLLYDIYHMQIDEGDVIATIKANHEFIGHYHTGGVPGRHEIDETQELYYPAICRAILETGYTGYLAQEFIPAKDKDPIASLRQGVRICDV